MQVAGHVLQRKRSDVPRCGKSGPRVSASEIGVMAPSAIVLTKLSIVPSPPVDTRLTVPIECDTRTRAEGGLDKRIDDRDEP